MKILEDIISTLKGGDFPVRSVPAHFFWTAVESKRFGLSSTFRESDPPMKEGLEM